MPTNKKGRVSLRLFICMTIGLTIGCDRTPHTSPNDAKVTRENQESMNRSPQAVNETPTVSKSPRQLPSRQRRPPPIRQTGQRSNRALTELEYDSEAYDRLTSFLETDRAGMQIDDFLTEVGLKGADYTILNSTNMDTFSMERIYHFDGFYMSIDVRCTPPKGGHTTQQIEELHERNEVVVDYMYPVVRIDGLNNPKERMKNLESARRGNFKAPDRSPRLIIKSVEIPSLKSSPLQISLQLEATGASPVAVSQSQFAVEVSTKEKPWLLVSEAVFPANEKRIFKVDPGQPSTLSFSTSTNRRGEKWNDLPRGEYILRVYIGGAKEREFDYQWNGQSYSDDFKLVIE